MEIVLGTYEGPIISYGIKLSTNVDLEPQFIEKSHSGCVKSIACNSRYLASGSSDETIRLLDLHKRVELGALMEHSGTITSLSFHGSHLLSGSEDGQICIFQCGSWDCKKTLKGHSSAVLQLAVHPTGVLALSVGRDKTLKTWSLITGKPVHTVNLQKLPDSVVWNTDGSLYTILSDRSIDVYQPSCGSPIRSYTSPKRIVTAKFISPILLCYGGEDKTIKIVNLETDKEQILEGHSARIKALDFVRSDVPHHYILASVSSDGDIRLWALSPDSHQHIGGTQMYNHRPVCMCVYTGEKNYLKQTSETVELKPKIPQKKTKVRRRVIFADLHAIVGGKTIRRKMKHKKRCRMIPLHLEPASQ